MTAAFGLPPGPPGGLRGLVDGGGAHAAEEWVTINSLHTVTAALTDTITAITA